MRRLDLDQGRARLAAGIDHEAAARREGAALGQIGKQRRLARNRGERLAHDARSRHRVEQAQGVGVARLAEDRRDRPVSTTRPAYMTARRSQVWAVAPQFIVTTAALAY